MQKYTIRKNVCARGGLWSSIVELGLGLHRSVQKPDGCRKPAVAEPGGTGLWGFVPPA